MVCICNLAALVFTLPAINASVLYKADGTPVSVEVYIQVQFVLRVESSFLPLKQHNFNLKVCEISVLN